MALLKDTTIAGTLSTTDLLVGGGSVNDFVIEYSFPSGTDNVWYRKYQSGWVEMGCLSGNRIADYATFTFNHPVALINNNYTMVAASDYSDADDGTWNGAWHIKNRSNTATSVYTRGATNGGRFISLHILGRWK